MEVKPMTDKEFAEVNGFVDWLVELINKIKEFFASLSLNLG